MLALINVHLPDYALRISGLVPLDKRLDFVAHFIPGLEERAAALSHGAASQEEVSDWIDTHLASYGKDARGLVREGMVADLNVFDPDTVAPDLPTVAHDLPAGEVRLKQTATGFLATIVAGEVVHERGEHTGALPGQLVRGPLAR